MAFVVDGSEWCFDGWSNEEAVKAIDNFLERVLAARDRNETVWIGEDFQTQPVLDELSLWDLCSQNAPISLSGEIWQELTAWLGTANCYLDDVWPDGFEDTMIQVDNDLAEENVDVAWVHYYVRARRSIACLGLKRAGMYRTISKLGCSYVHWVGNEDTHRAFWRAAIDVEGDSEPTLVRIAPHAFPDLYFHNGVWHGLNRLVGGYYALSSQIQKYLAVLDDYGKWAFTCSSTALSPEEPTEFDPRKRPSNQIVERRFQGLGLEMAPEKPEVSADNKCRHAREITIGEQSLYCEWHGKLEPHHNRMHVHSPIPESNDKVIIAIFDEHLPLPRSR